ncbi:unnamed protein product, partial [Prorocentrum cordatum]
LEGLGVASSAAQHLQDPRSRRWPAGACPRRRPAPRPGRRPPRTRGSRRRGPGSGARWPLRGRR